MSLSILHRRRFLQSAPPPDVSNGILEHYKLDQYKNDGLNANFDSQTSSNFLETINGPSLVAGKLGNCLDFTQNNQRGLVDTTEAKTTLSFANNGDLPFSYSLWIYPTNLSGNNPVIFEKAGNSGGTFYADYIFFWNTAANALRFQIHDDDNSLLRVTDSTPNRLSLNQWYHIAVTYDGNQTSAGITIYVNGSAIGLTVENSGNYQPRAGQSITGLNIANRDNSGNPYQGKIDQLLIYNRELTSSEVGTLYNNGNGIAL